MDDFRNNERNTAVHGDVVGGDKIAIGDIKNAKGIAVGRGSTVVINEVLSKPLMFVLFALIFTIILIVLVPDLRSFFSPLAKPLEVISMYPIDEVAGEFLQDVVVLGDDVWFSTAAGLISVDDGRQVEHYLKGESITAIVADSQSNQIWLGTESGTVAKVNSSGELSIIEKFQNTTITAITVDQSGRIWVANSEKIQLFNTDGTLSKLTVELPKGESIYDLAVAMLPEQTFIMANTFSGLYRWSGSWEKRFEDKDGLPTEYLEKVFVDVYGGMWLAHGAGISYIPADADSRISISNKIINCNSDKDDIPSGSVLDLAIGDEWLWIVTENGLARKNVFDMSEQPSCISWQSHYFDSDSDNILSGIWSMAVHQNVCKIWLVTDSGAKAYSLSFDCEGG